MSDKTLNELIDEIVLKKFVSLEGADIISAMKKNALVQTLLVTSLTNERDTAVKLNERYRTDNLAQATELAAFKAADEAMKKREAKALENELNAKHALEMAQLSERLFNTVFRNSVMSRTLAGNVGGSVTLPNGGTYLSPIPVSRSETETLA